MQGRGGRKMKHYLRQHGSALIILIVIIVIMSALGIAMLSMRTASSYTQMNTNATNRAYYLAESGRRYANFSTADNKTYTLANGDKFQLTFNADNVESLGIIHKDSAFESIRKNTGVQKKGMPCWTFDNSLNRGEDYCGSNNGTLKGTAITPVTPGRIGDALQFDGSGWIDTPFKPVNEIGNGKPFSISFWATPGNIVTNQVVLGVSDADYRFSVGISSVGKWYWAYGDRDNQTVTAIDAALNQWQKVTLVYTGTSGTNEMKMYVSRCNQQSVYNYAASGGIAELPTGVKNLFIGGENTGGAMPNLPFTGLIDEVNIYDRELKSDEITPPFDAIAYYPFSNNADDASAHLLNGNFDPASGGGPILTSDRFNCPDKAYVFDGTDDYLYVPDNNLLDLSTAGTLAAWININSYKSRAGIIHKGNNVSFSDEAYSLQFGWGSDEQKILFALNAANTVSSLVNLGIINRWYHVAATWDNTGIRLYIDGTLNNSNPVINISAKNSAGNLNIGAQLPAGQHYMDTSVSPPADRGNLPFDGIIDDVLIFNRALSDAEIAALAADKP
jgi:Tfp pilus assembly protein PilX